MKLAIVDEQRSWIEKELEIVYCCFQKEKIQVDTYSDGKQLLQSDKEYDIVIMDIEFKGKKDGFLYAKLYRERYREFVLIIVTAHTEFSREGYYVNAFRYIDKMHMEELEEALEKARDHIKVRYVKLNIANVGNVKIDCKNILYLEAQNHNVELHTMGQIWDVKETIREILPKMDDKQFYPVHRSYIVSFQAIKYCSENAATLMNGESIPISRRRYKEFQKEYYRWQLSQKSV